MISLSIKEKKVIILIMLVLVILLLVMYFYLPEPEREIKMKAVAPLQTSFLKPLFSLRGVSSNEKTLSFEMPYDVALDDLGNLYITDIQGNRIFVFTREGKFVRTFGSFGITNPPGGAKATWGEGSFANPAGVDVDAEGNIYVVDTGNKRVNVYNSKGKYLFYFPKESSLVNPTMIKVKGNKIYLSDRGGIKVFSKRGKFLKVIGEGKVLNPAGLAVDREGRIYVAEPLLSRLICFSSKGAVLWEKGGGKSREIGIPFDLAVDNVARLLFVTDAFRHQIVVYTLDGKELGRTGKLGREEGEFAFPRGICFSPNGVLYVADSNNRRVQAFKINVESLLSPEIFLKR
jgi:DNA-binding beta-propeller fold protein YncE